MPGAESGNIRLVTDQVGRLLLILSFPGQTSAETAWACLWTSGHRTLRGLAGTCVHDGVGDRRRQVVEAAKARVWNDAEPLAPKPLGAAVAKWLLPAHPEPAAEALVARFREACGPATLSAAFLGAPSARLAPLDARFGANAVDRAFEAVPLLAAIALHPGAPALPVEISDAFHAFATGEGLPEALVVLSRRLADAGNPQGGVRDILEDLLDHEAVGFGPRGGLRALGIDPDDGDDFDASDDFDDFGDPEPGDDRRAPRPAAQDDVRLAALPGLPQGDPAACAALVARLGTACVPVGQAPALIRETAWIPRDWIPADADEAACCAEVLSLALDLALESGGALSPMALVAPAKGRWRRFADLLGRANPLFAVRDPRLGPGEDRLGDRLDHSTLVIGVRDMVRRFVDQLARPAAAWATSGAVGPVEGRRDLHLAAWKLLFRDKGLAAVLQASAEWHARRMEIDRLVRTLSDGRQWPRPFPDFTASNGIVATPLLSAQELGEEGAALLHCAGDYADACHAGRSVVVSLRRIVGGRETRTSTLELAWLPLPGPGRPPTIVQHRGRLNGNPAPEDVAAAAELLAWVAADLARTVVPVRTPHRGVRRRPPRTLLQAWERRVRALADRIDPPPPREREARGRRAHASIEGHRLAVHCGYDWRDPAQTGLAHEVWGPFLPRDLRGSLPGLAAALGAGAAPPPAGPPPRARPAPSAASGLVGAHLRLARSALAWVRRARGNARLAIVVAGALAAGAAAWSILPDPSAGTDRPPDAAGGLHDRLARLARRCPVLPVPAGEGGAGPCAALGPLRIERTDSLSGPAYRVLYVAEGLPTLPLADAFEGETRWRQPEWQAYVMGKLDEADAGREASPPRPGPSRGPPVRE